MNSFSPINHSLHPPAAGGEEHRQHGGQSLDRVARVLTSEALFRGSQEIGIEHAGSMYRLKITRQGKLILNK